MADGSSRVEVLVAEGELETTGGGAEVANGTVESRRATAQLEESLIIFKTMHNSNTDSRLYTQNETKYRHVETPVNPILKFELS